ncbi:predicted protein [Pyrenophora tritici-repentis Pt-1C-BFP]|uniref:Uncharacterized protein n=1 Tax=Pyrenophora tritici-repentis (strain Pt-1C-BFP) TaxID=426418 RepID=B2W959_PYRTR|nr:uncharacterized protein PTRG_06517 [Pyrenophora tritici-repentis Pt-1C-BFP]EDU49437.1 predicted protein [Pyrenophora tritici-repentis Pt-1C-BFP]
MKIIFHTVSALVLAADYVGPLDPPRFGCCDPNHRREGTFRQSDGTCRVGIEHCCFLRDGTDQCWQYDVYTEGVGNLQWNTGGRCNNDPDAHPVWTVDWNRPCP